MKTLLIALSALLTPLAVSANRAPVAADTSHTKTPAEDRSAPAFHLQADIQSLPFTMVHEFPFVDAEINGTRGKLMFDTGNENALSLNDHLLTNLGPGIGSGSGFVGSGQKFTVTLRSQIDRVTIGSGENVLHFADLPHIQSQDTRFLEGITPDCLGWIGYNFFKGYLMKLDYDKKVLTFYRATPARYAAKDFLQGETVVAVLPFTTRKLPNHPLIPLKVGNEEMLGAFDTGQIGMVQMTDEMQQTLTGQHLLTALSKPEANEGPTGGSVTRCRIEGIHLTGEDGQILTTSVEGVPVFNKPSPAAVPMATPEANIISLGYAFLSQYKTVWDYEGKRIYVLKR